MATSPSPAGDKIPYTLDPTGKSSSGEKALEHIAHYLDRIESHLDRIATAMEADAGNAQLRTAMLRVEQALRQDC